jgi:hypothetical protein
MQARAFLTKNFPSTNTLAYFPAEKKFLVLKIKKNQSYKNFLSIYLLFCKLDRFQRAVESGNYYETT